MRKLILHSHQSPGDVVMLTAAVRDLHAAHPRQFQTDVRTSADALWDHNPYLTRLADGDADVEHLDMHYPLIHQSNERPYHFLHGYTQFLEQTLGVSIPVTRFRGDIHLSPAERAAPVPVADDELEDGYWIVVAGGKYDFTAKWWNPACFQQVVDHFQGRIRFVQCGEAGHWHPPLKNVVNLVGQTDLREFVRLIYHADGVLCPVTLAMHLAAAVETKPGRLPHRPCVVVAGGREPAHWEAYPQHQFLSTNGALACCAQGGCWKSRCQTVGDGDLKDRRNRCEHPVAVSPELQIPKCMHLITADDVIQRIELYYRGGALPHANGQTSVAGPASRRSRQTAPRRRNSHGDRAATETTPSPAPPQRSTSRKRQKQKIRVSFHHGLGDCAYFAHMIPLYTRRGYAIEVACPPDRCLLFEAAGATTVASGTAATVHPWSYPPGGTHSGQGRFWQGSKMGHNLSQPPLPDIGPKDELWPEYCETRIDIARHLPAKARQTAERWLAGLPRPILLLHTKGNTAQNRKSLPDAITAELYQALIDRTDGTLVLLDWDHRVPRLSSYRVRHLDDLGACSTETLLALMTQADLLVGVDSGPLHLSRFTPVPTVGVWRPGHYPSTYSLPRREQLNVVLTEHTRPWNRFKRIPWNLVEHEGDAFQAARLAEFCRQMLEPSRYLGSADRAADVQLQQFIRDWCRGRRGNALSDYPDRHRSFDVLFREAARRFETPTIVETGAIRAEEDWAGAGFFTYLAGTFLLRRGGRLHSVDMNPTHCAFARDWMSVFGETVQVHAEDSVGFLKRFADPIDVLYLDSLDTTEPNHAAHALREVQAALPRLHDRSLVVFDDTPWQGGAWIGKGARAVPWLLERGWSIAYAGYQVVLTRQAMSQFELE